MRTDQEHRELLADADRRYKEIQAARETIEAWNANEVAVILKALSAVDEKDLDYLVSRLGDGGRDQFWKAVIRDMRPVFALEVS